MFIKNTMKTPIISLLFLITNPSFSYSTFNHPINIGTLKNLYTTKSKGEDYYKFTLPYATPVTIFLNGLSAGYKIQLLDAQRMVLHNSSNNGISWSDPSNPGSTGGTLLTELQSGTYFVHVIPTKITGNPIYKTKDNSYTLNFIPDNTPNMVIVAAYDSPIVGKPNFIATGIKDEVILNEAIAYAGSRDGGIVLLRPGLYNISNNVLITFDNITLTGSGWNTILKLADHTQLKDAGLLRSMFHEKIKCIKKKSFDNQHFLHLALDGNKGKETSFKNSYGNFGTYTNTSFEDIRIHDFPHYGFDPHGNSYVPVHTDNLIIKDSLSDHNDVDGLTVDHCYNSKFYDNIIISNGRHGINVCTGSTSDNFSNNLIENNKGNGVVIQPGSNLLKVSNNHIIKENSINKNRLIGIEIYRSKNNKILNNTIRENGRHGIRLRASSHNQVHDNKLGNNSEVFHGEYIGILLTNSQFIYSTFNSISNNYISPSKPFIYKFGIAEDSSLDDYNQYTNNVLLRIENPIRLKGVHSSDNGEAPLNSR